MHVAIHMTKLVLLHVSIYMFIQLDRIQVKKERKICAINVEKKLKRRDSDVSVDVIGIFAWLVWNEIWYHRYHEF